MNFNLIKKLDNGIRVGELVTAHGAINTPFFMPVGTVGSVKGVSPQELSQLGAKIVLSNTYHLYLRPGEKLIKKMNGLHEFMRWSGPILTDSGGYQVFSLGKKLENNQNAKNISKNLVSHCEGSQTTFKSNDYNKSRSTSHKPGKSLVKITNDGVEFTSHLDGSKHFFTPEKVIDIQLDLGVDILMPLDVCPSGKASKKEIEEATSLTIEWAKRAKNHFDKKLQRLKLEDQNQKSNSKSMYKKDDNIDKKLKNYSPQANVPALFGIVQGGLDPKLRKYCAKELININFDGYSVGGLAVDHETRDMWKTVKLMGEILPQQKPRYLMGVGTPDDIYKAMRMGMDMFDCVLPTRLARHGSVYVKNQELKTKVQDHYKLINLLNSKYRTDPKIIEEGCNCPACSGGFSRAYISHLIRSKEILGIRLATLHNLHVYIALVKDSALDK